MPATENVLVTIRLSHYCEKARWALQHTRTPFRESAHAPGFHVPAVRRAHGRRTTPVLVTPSGVFCDSTDILAHLDAGAVPERRLYPDACGAQVLALEERFDEDLGPHARRLIYHHLLPRRGLALSLFAAGVPTWERLALPLVFPLLRRVMRRSMRIDAAGAERSRAKVDSVFAEVDERLADGRKYLVGGRFTAADLTFAALAAPLIGPSNYGGGMPADDTLPPELLAIVAPWRATQAAEHVRRMYRTHRDG